VRRVGKTIVMTVERGRSTEADSSASLRNDKEKGLRNDKEKGLRNDKETGLRNDKETGLRNDKQGAEFLIHLGMTGRLLVSAPEVALPAHTHAVLTLSGGNELRFVDARRFGRLSVRTAEAYVGPGAEPLAISEEQFVALFRGRKTPIKAALLNQSLLHGVGNIYADESLFRAGVRPRRPAGRLTREELLRLRKALVQVLKHSIKLGGSSVSDYVDADGVRGFFQLEHKVYGRAGEACRDCGAGLKKLVVGGRTTVYCPTCQR